MSKKQGIPKYLDLLLILNEEDTYTKIHKNLPRCDDYIIQGLKTLREKEMISITENPKDARRIIIKLTQKGRDTQKIVSLLYTQFDLKR